MVGRVASCGCPWDGIWCPHCGRGQQPAHILRCHRAALGEGPDCWHNGNARTTLRGTSQTWPQNLDECCRAELPGYAECSRETGHPGRHMGALGRPHGWAIVAAWPGRHAPVKSDLKDPAHPGEGDVS